MGFTDNPMLKPSRLHVEVKHKPRITANMYYLAIIIIIVLCIALINVQGTSLTTASTGYLSEYGLKNRLIFIISSMDVLFIPFWTVTGAVSVTDWYHQGEPWNI